jgi:hypothetical protein
MGVTNFDVVRANVLIGASLVTQGNVWHVKPILGADDQSGRSPEEAVKTLSKALSLASSNQNDIILLYAGSNTASATTDYQSATLSWNKDMVHLVGVGANSLFSQRARIAVLSTATGVSPLVNLSANGCVLKNLQIFGSVGTDTTSLIGLTVTGDRNVIEDCHIAVGTAVISAAGAADLKLDTASENVFRRCVIGNDAVTRDADTEGNVWLDGESSRNVFEDCIFPAHISSTAYEHIVFEDALAIDRILLFKNCIFYSTSQDYATPQDQIIEFKATLTRGKLLLHGCTAMGDDTAIVWVTSGTGNLHASMPAAATNAAGGLATDL